MNDSDNTLDGKGIFLGLTFGFLAPIAVIILIVTIIHHISHWLHLSHTTV